MSRREHYEFQYGATQTTDFPLFRDGDVRIVITGFRQYHLHSSILKEISPVMRELLSEDYAAKLSSKAIKKGVTTRHRLIAVKNPDPDPYEPDVEIVLEPVVLDEEGKSHHPQPIGLDLENGLLPRAIHIVSDRMVEHL